MAKQGRSWLGVRKYISHETRDCRHIEPAHPEPSRCLDHRRHPRCSERSCFLRGSPELVEGDLRGIPAQSTRGPARGRECTQFRVFFVFLHLSGGAQVHQPCISQVHNVHQLSSCLYASSLCLRLPCLGLYILRSLLRSPSLRLVRPYTHCCCTTPSLP